MEADDGEYNNALDNRVPEDDGNDMAEDVGDSKKHSMDVATSLGLTEAPKPSASTQVLIDQHPEICPDYRFIVDRKLPLQGDYTQGGDPNHKTYPFLTLYETAKILSFRSSQLAHGAAPFIAVPDHITKVDDIARLELAEKRLPFIIKRPLPDGTFEYWRLADLMIL